MWLCPTECLARGSLAQIFVYHIISKTISIIWKGEKGQNLPSFYFLFRKVDENAPNVSQIIPFLVDWLIYTNHRRSSFSNAYKLVRGEVFIKSYIPSDTQYSSTQLRRKAIHWRDENPRERCCGVTQRARADRRTATSESTREQEHLKRRDSSNTSRSLRWMKF